jgi:ribose 5-phosphate isomerase B
MKIFLGTEHAGFQHKEYIKEGLLDAGYDVQDLGAFEYDKDDDYPEYIKKVAEAVVAEGEGAKGVVFGGSGQGEAMVANRYEGIRCALFYGEATPLEKEYRDEEKGDRGIEIIKLSREHNNANMISIGARFVKDKDALFGVLRWLDTDFSREERHERRIEAIDA